LVPELLKKKSYAEKLRDEAASDAELSVYPVNNKPTPYIFCIDSIKKDMGFKLSYRYVPQWRYRFENKYAAFTETLTKHRVDKFWQADLGTTTHFEGFNFALAIDSTTQHKTELDAMYKELLDIERIFPKHIINSQDLAYKNYVALRKDLEQELKAQKDYLDLLDIFYAERKTWGEPASFINLTPQLIAFFGQANQYPENVLSECRNVIGTRLNTISPFYASRLAGKDDDLPYDAATYRLKALDSLGILHDVASIPKSDGFSQLVKFVVDYNKGSSTLLMLKDSLQQARKSLADLNEMPSDLFFTDLVTRLQNIRNSIPSPIDASYGTLQALRSVGLYTLDITNFIQDVDRRLAQCKQAQNLVYQLNILKSQKEYGMMISTLLQNRHLDFLYEKYRSLDKMALDVMAAGVSDAISAKNWSSTEAQLSRLNVETGFLFPAQSIPDRQKLASDFEDSLYLGVEKASRLRVSTFLEENVRRFDNVDSLYADSVFYPVYTITFSSGNKSDLIARREQLVADLARLKETEFPSRAIKTLYEEFIRNPQEDGVLKARAIVTHGQHYKGDDKDIKVRVAECNPLSSKWIVKPKEYRRVFALPVTDNRKGNNRYIVRLNVNVPSEAQFPVWDVNIKLPKEIAKDAAASQWFDEITINKKPLKNEGRFSITAPSAANDWECQITPVQMNKDQGNVLEISFTHPSFKVHTISVMVQRPIIKKN
jgi:hypothetical protein